MSKAPRVLSDRRHELAADPEHLAFLMAGVEAWNAWRVREPRTTPVLRGVDFTSRERFGGSPLWRDASCAELRVLKDRCDLSGADLSGVDFRGSDFTGCELMDCDLRGAKFIFCKLTDAQVWDCHVDRTDFGGADLTGADFGGVIYRRSQLRDGYLSVRGTSDILGDAVFRRDVQDQEFIDTLAARRRRSFTTRARFIYDTRSGFTVNALIGGAAFSWIAFLVLLNVAPATPGWLIVLWSAFFGALFGALNGPVGRAVLLEAWRLFDYGRSWTRVVVFAAICVTILGTAFSWADPVQLGLRDSAVSGSGLSTVSHTMLHPYLLAAIGFLSGGIVGIGQIRTALGYVLVFSDAAMGYVTLGLLLAVLGNTFGRRSG